MSSIGSTILATGNVTNIYGTGVKIGNAGLPDFTRMYSKTEPARSDDEILEAVMELAKKHAENGTFQNPDKEFLSLEKEYVSSVSPDRENIIKNSMKQIGTINQTLTNAGSPEYIKTLLDLLINKEKGNDKIIVNGYGNGFGKLHIEGDKLHYVEFYGSKGEVIACYDSKNGWSGGIMTKEEASRLNEFCSAYNETWRSTTAEIESKNNKNVPKYLEGGTTIDVYA